MAELRTQQNDEDVLTFLKSIKDETKKKDSFEILKMMKSVTREEPQM